MRTYNVTLTDISDTSEMHLILFLSTYARDVSITSTTITCTCTSPVLASLILLFMESELECNISYRRL